ncbi:MAG: biopolymer transporter ExbD [Planctomycetes bacterium]|nr:biopolymer transporter ExbD [Planctomycetota bacterium]
MKLRQAAKRDPQIPLSAMSDIALLLLIFFVLTTQFLVRRSLQAELPSITPDKEEASEDVTTVVVKPEYMYLDEERIHIEELAPLLAAKLADKTKPEDRAVILDGEAAVRYERMVLAANEIKRAGGIVTIMKVEE